jgi:hypothetical protein
MGLDAMARVALTDDEASNAVLGRTVAPSAGLPEVDETVPILITAGTAVIGVGRRRANRLEPDKILVERGAFDAR